MAMRSRLSRFGLTFLLVNVLLLASRTWVLADTCEVTDNARRVYLHDFQAAGDGKTDDGPAIRAALAAAISGPKPASLEFDPGKTYRIASFEDRYALRLLNVQRFTLRGNGAELLLRPPNKAIKVDNSSDVSVCGLTIDYSPLPFTQGLIAAVNFDDNTADLQIADGFEVPAADDSSVAENNAVWGFAIPFLGPRQFDRRVQISTVYATDTPRKVKIKFARPADVDRLIPGKTHLVMTMPKIGQTGGSAFAILNSKQIHFESIRVYAVPQFTFYVGNNLGPIGFVDIQQRPRPGTDRVMTGWRDIFQVKGNRAPVTWNNCYTEGAFDDSFNLSATFQLVDEKLGGNRWRLRDLSAVGTAPPFRSGDRLQAISLVPDRKVLGESKVESVTQSGKETLLTISPPLPLMSYSDDCKGESEVCASRVIDLDAANEGSVIAGCDIHGSMRLRSKTTVERIKLDGTLQITADSIRVGPLPDGLVFKDSEFSGHIRIGPDNTERKKYNARWDTGERWARNIVFQNNRIMSVFRAEGASFSLIGNDIVWPPRRRFLLDNSGPIHVKDLKANGAPVYNPAALFKGAHDMTKEEIIIDGR